MSLFANKLKEFLGNNWDNQIDIDLNNQLIKQRNSMLSNQAQAQEFITNFMQANAVLISKASPEFQQKINDLTTYLTEAFDGYWEETSLSIKDKKGKNIHPDVINRIKKMGLEDYSTKIRADIESPKSVLIVPRLLIKNIKPFEDEVKAISNTLVVSIINSASNYNIANKVNKQKAEEEQNGYGDAFKNQEANYYNKKISMEESNNINDMMFMEDINTGVSTGYEGMNECDKDSIDGTYNAATKMLNKEGLAYEATSLKEFIKKNFDKVKKICEQASSNIDTHRLYALMEADDLKEMTTADINVPQLGITGVMRNRLNNFDPYGKNLANKQNGSKTVVKMESDVLKESIKRIDLKKAVIIGTDIDTTNKYSNVIVESAGKKHGIVIDRADFIKFVQNNADVANYMENGKLNETRYFKSRTSTFVGVLLKEYFNRILTEEVSNDFKVEDFRKQGNIVEVDYYYEGDTEVSTLQIKWSDFENFVKDLYSDMIENNPKLYYQQDESSISNENPRGSYHFNFEFFLEHNGLGSKELMGLLKQYITSKGLLKLKEAKIIKEAQQSYVDDYNEWKDCVATLTRNNYQIKRSNDQSLNTKAVNAAGETVGEWNPAKTNGWYVN